MNYITVVITVFGIITITPLLIVQLIMLINPRGKRVRDLLIGKDEQWRDESHFKSAYSLALADWLLFFPFFITATVAVFTNQFWGYLCLIISGSIQLYINIFLFFFEKKYVYPANGPLKYYTYIWGNFMIWGSAAVIHGIVQLRSLVTT